jgi:hypothetical protein
MADCVDLFDTRVGEAVKTRSPFVIDGLVEP